MDAAYFCETYHRREMAWLVQRVGTRQDAEDILSDAYLRVCAHKARIPIRQADAWFRSVVRSCWVDHLRNRGAQKRGGALQWVEWDEWEEAVEAQPHEGSEAAFEAAVAGVDVQEIFEQAALTELQQTLILGRLAGWPLLVMARQLGISRSAARTQYEAGMSGIRAIGEGH